MSSQNCPGARFGLACYLLEGTTGQHHHFRDLHHIHPANPRICDCTLWDIHERTLNVLADRVGSIGALNFTQRRTGLESQTRDGRRCGGRSIGGCSIDWKRSVCREVR